VNSTPIRPTRSTGARALLLAVLFGASLSLPAAERLPQPVANAASALRSVLGEAARPATAAASAVRQAVETAPKPAALAASAASAVKSALQPLVLPAAASASAPAPAPRATPTPLVPPAAITTACLRPSDQVAACQPGQQLSLPPIALPTARLGVAYKPRRMVAGGVAPYRVDLVEGSQPEGLDFTPDGSLAGRPIGAVRTHRFTVQVTDASTPPLSVRQAYVLRVEQVAAPRPAASAAPAAPVVVPTPAAAEIKPAGPPQITVTSPVSGS